MCAGNTVRNMGAVCEYCLLCTSVSSPFSPEFCFLQHNNIFFGQFYLQKGIATEQRMV
jgi:hypothetical protein